MLRRAMCRCSIGSLQLWLVRLLLHSLRLKAGTEGIRSSTVAVQGAGVLVIALYGSCNVVVEVAAIVMVTGLVLYIIYLLRMGWITNLSITG